MQVLSNFEAKEDDILWLIYPKSNVLSPKSAGIHGFSDRRNWHKTVLGNLNQNEIFFAFWDIPISTRGIRTEEISVGLSKMTGMSATQASTGK